MTKIKTNTKTENKAEMVYLPIETLFHHPNNPRKALGDLAELTDSIKQNGVFQNLTVVPWFDPNGEDTNTPIDENRYYVIIGNRRLEAAKSADLKELPCVVANMPFKDQIRTMLIENMQRSDLTVYEQAKGFQMMLDLGDTVETIAEQSGFSQSTVRSRVKLLELDEDKFKASVERNVSLFDYMKLDKIKDPKLKNKVLDSAGTANFSNELKKAIATEKNKQRILQIEADLSRFATKVTDRDGLIYVKSYNSYIQSDAVTPPEDADTVQYYYRLTTYGYIELLRDENDEEKVEKSAAKEKEHML